MCSSGIVSSAGAGKIIAEMIMNVQSSVFKQSWGTERLPLGSNNKFYLRAAGPATLSATYALKYPRSESISCRNIMNSPLHSLLDIQGASWGTLGNWERCNFFKLNEKGLLFIFLFHAIFLFFVKIFF